MARTPFETIFTVNTADNSLTTKVPIRVGGISLPAGYIIRSGTILGAVDLTQYISHALEVTTDDGVFVITGIY